MKSFTYAAAALGLVSQTLAFPALMTDPDSPLVKEALSKGLLDRDVYEMISKRQVQGSGAAPPLAPLFDAADQYVSNTGSHAFVAPGSGDARGPCPGLNAMANHNYLPHNGVATIAQFITGTFDVFGMGTDLATFLAVYGSLLDGTLTGWSIGGAEHTGIGGSHGNYETDSSPVYADLNQYGSNEVVISQFTDLFNLQPDAATANYNLEVLRDFRGTRFQESIDKNPYFAYNPVGGILVSQAAFTFIYRFMANHSAENPEGILNQEVLKSFYSITGDDPSSFVWTKGHEKIPNNWYRRNGADAYTIPYFNLDILYFTETVPQLLEVGCNQGAVDTYDQISVETISGGAYTAASVAANPLCFVVATMEAGAASLLGLPTGSLSSLTTAIDGISSALGLTCPAITDLNLTELKACPGFSLYGGPTGPVAPGAIQD